MCLISSSRHFAETSLCNLESPRRCAATAGVRFLAETTKATTADAVWRVRRFEPIDRRRLAAGAGAVSSYDVLAGRVTVVPGSRLVAIGDDLSIAEAALLAAARGAHVTLLSSGPSIARDAHPGYREVTRRKLRQFGAEIATGSESPADTDVVVVGHDPALNYDSPDAWITPSGNATAYVADAYEPGVFTAGVYKAVTLALAFGGPEPNEA